MRMISTSTVTGMTDKTTSAKIRVGSEMIRSINRLSA